MINKLTAMLLISSTIALGVNTPASSQDTQSQSSPKQNPPQEPRERSSVKRVKLKRQGALVGNALIQALLKP